MDRRTVLRGSATLVVGAFAGCAGSNAGGGETTTRSTTTAGGMGDVTVHVKKVAEYGAVLVDGDGIALYMFDNDSQNADASTCSGGCASAWPPLTVDGKPTAGDGVDAELTTFKRDDGSTQVAANGWPLYYYAGDDKTGDTNGQGVKDVWWLLTPDGTPIRNPESTTTTSSGTY